MRPAAIGSVGVLLCLGFACGGDDDRGRVGAPDDTDAAWSSSSSGQPGSSGASGGGGSSGQVIPPIEVPACLSAEGAQDGDFLRFVDDERAQGSNEGEPDVATFSVSGEACARTFTVQTTANLRDNRPDNPRTVRENAERPSLQSGSPLFDALYQLALEEAEECAVDSIRDYAFNDGAPVGCGNGGCFETGANWHYVWTRDTAYAVDLGLAWASPVRAANSLEFKLSERRAGGGLEIVQDTGTGGSYPVSTDRVSWVFGAEAQLAHLSGAAHAAFSARAREALVNTVRRDRELIYDTKTGLYRGEQSFLDWREQSYPAWAVPDLTHIAMSQALSTNVGHYQALRTAAFLQQQAGEDPSELEAWASALRQAIRDKLWIAEESLPSTFLTTMLDPAPARQYDLLGLSLAILSDVLSPEEARAALSAYPTLPKGPPVLFPEQQFTPVYHNRGIWPFVTAYWVRAAHKAGHAAAFSAGVRSLVRGAALNLSNMENLELVTGQAYFEDGSYSGPVVNSQRQLWSVAGYFGMVNQDLFGLQPKRGALHLEPFVTAEVHRRWLAGSRSVALNRVQWQGKSLSVQLNLPELGQADGVYRVLGIRINGAAVSSPVAQADLADANWIEIDLGQPEGAGPTLRTLDDVSDYRVLYAPRPPTVGVSLQGGKLRLALGRGGEDADQVTFAIYRDGVRLAQGLAGSTSEWIDEGTSEASPSHCYTVETRFSSGNTSQRANPACYWGSGNARIQVLPINGFSRVGGALSGDQSMVESWGDRGHSLTGTFTAARDGAHLLSAAYANGAGPLSTGITAAMKLVVVERVSDGQIVGGGTWVMPQRGSNDWASRGESSFVRATLQAGVQYRLRIGMDERTVNMTDFAHFNDYTGGTGGRDGAFFRVNVGEVKLLGLE